MWDVITHLCADFSGGFVKAPLRLGSWWVVPSHVKTHVIIHPCHNLIHFLLIKRAHRNELGFGGHSWYVALLFWTICTKLTVAESSSFFQSTVIDLTWRCALMWYSTVTQDHPTGIMVVDCQSHYTPFWNISRFTALSCILNAMIPDDDL